MTEQEHGVLLIILFGSVVFIPGAIITAIIAYVIYILGKFEDLEIDTEGDIDTT